MRKRRDEVVYGGGHGGERKASQRKGTGRKVRRGQGAYQMIPHFGEASSWGTAERIASTAAANCGGREARSTVLIARLSMDDGVEG